MPSHVPGHLDVEDLRDAMEALPAGPALPTEAPIPTAIPVAAGETFAPHGAPVVRVLVAPRAHLHAIQGGAGRLLTVREVAERLAVSTATVYALCEDGDLQHVRISNAIRIEPAGWKRSSPHRT